MVLMLTLTCTHYHDTTITYHNSNEAITYTNNYYDISYHVNYIIS